jgi:hypothetical protein
VSSLGGENFKLGAVQVGLFTRDAIDMLVPALKNCADCKIQQQSDKSDFYQSGAFYFRYLQNPIQTAETDAEGKFVMNVPKQGSFVLGGEG